MTKNSKVMEQITRIVVEFLREEGIQPAESEEQVREILHQAGAAALGQRWSEQTAGEEPERIECACGNQMKRRGRRVKKLLTLLGWTGVERSYYWCRKCGKGRYLLDEQLGCRGRAQTGKVQECVALTMAEETYCGGRHLLATLSGLEIPHSTLEAITLQLGKALEQTRDEEIEQALQGELTSPERPGTLCVSVDGGKVPMEDSWHEARVVAVFPYEVPPGGSEAEPGRVSYSGRVEDCHATGKRMYAEAVRRGALFAQLIVALGDGAEWIWNQIREHFPGVIEILDWFHAIQHLWEVANALFGEGTPEAATWEKARENELWDGKVAEVVAILRGLFWEKRRSEKDFLASDREHVIQTNLAYFELHQKRMDYPRFRALNLPIGSGVVESACKHYLAQRCKRSGMRWKKDGLHSVLELRSALLSDEWYRVQNLLKAA